MGVYKKRLKTGDRWLYKKTIRGVKLESPAIFLTKRAAEEAEARAAAEYLATGNLPTHLTTRSAIIAPSVMDLLVERTKWVGIHRSPAHAADHKLVFRHLLHYRPEWASLLATEISPSMAVDLADEWAADLFERGKGGSLVNRALTLLQTTWNRPWGTRRGRFDFPENPWRFVERKRVRRAAKYLPTDADVAAVLLAAPTDHRVYFEVLAGTGARPGEALQLQWRDIFADQEPFSVTLFTAKKAGGDFTPRRIPVEAHLANRLRSWRKSNPTTTYVFQGGHSDPAPRGYTWARKGQVAACTAAGVIFFPLHSWRHWYASRLYRENVDRARIQMLLGHENASTTDRYLHAILGLAPAGPWGK